MFHGGGVASGSQLAGDVPKTDDEQVCTLCHPQRVKAKVECIGANLGHLIRLQMAQQAMICGHHLPYFCICRIFASSCTLVTRYYNLIGQIRNYLFVCFDE